MGSRTSAKSLRGSETEPETARFSNSSGLHLDDTAQGLQRDLDAQAPEVLHASDGEDARNVSISTALIGDCDTYKDTGCGIFSLWKGSRRCLRGAGSEDHQKQTSPSIFSGFTAAIEVRHCSPATCDHCLGPWTSYWIHKKVSERR